MVRFEDGSLWHTPPPTAAEVMGYFQKDKEICRHFAHTTPVPTDYPTTSKQSSENAGDFRVLDADAGFAFTWLKDKVLTCPLK
jgi:hypothetical protein